MPGLFTSTSFPRQDARAHLYEPAPQSPSETSGLQVTGADHATRKRSRYDNVDYYYGEATSPATGRPSLGYSRPELRSPPPLANDRYELAGGMDMTDKFARQNGNFDDYFRLEKSRGTWSTPTSPQHGMPPQLGAAEQQETIGGSKPWMINQLMNMMGGVAGKLYQFCSVPFRGFQAGGGQQYTIDNQEVAAKLGLNDEPEKSEPCIPAQQTWFTQCPNDNYGVLSVESVDDERPRAKRQRTAENWVFVNNDGGMVSNPGTPRMPPRRIPVSSNSPSQIPRPVSRASVPTPSQKRPSLLPVSRRSTLDRKSFHTTVQTASRPQSSQSSHGRSYSRQSYGSPVLFNDSVQQRKSPLPIDSQRLINKMRREEFEDDARLRRMSSQMSAMLREAQEALGSKFEIGDDHMDDTDNHRSNRSPMFS